MVPPYLKRNRSQVFKFAVKSYNLRVTGYGLRVKGCEFRVTGYEFRVASFGLRVAGTKHIKEIQFLSSDFCFLTSEQTVKGDHLSLRPGKNVFSRSAVIPPVVTADPNICWMALGALFRNSGT